MSSFTLQLTLPIDDAPALDRQEVRKRKDREYAARVRAEIRERMESDPDFAAEYKAKRARETRLTRARKAARLADDPEGQERWLAQKRANTAAYRERRNARMEIDPEYRERITSAISEQNRRYADENRERIAEKNRRYALENAERARARVRAWREANKSSASYKQKRREDSQRRRMRKLGQEVTADTDETSLVIDGKGPHVEVLTVSHIALTRQWSSIVREDPCCYSRSAQPALHIDHIVPVRGGGLHAWTNLIGASQVENQLKSTKSLLIHLLEREEA